MTEAESIIYPTEVLSNIRNTNRNVIPRFYALFASF
jgi:hypothetical protein